MSPSLVDSYNVVWLCLLFTPSGHESVGCYELHGTSRLTHELTGSDHILNGIYPAQPGSFISKCAVAVIRAGYRLFAVENNDTCSANATTPHFGFTPSEVSLKYELNLEARLNIEGKALSNNENYNGLYIKILRLKNRINCLLRASFVNTFWSRNSACW